MIGWEPPTGMLPSVVRDWKTFFRRMESGSEGYALTAERYVQLYRFQNGRCAICASAKGINPDDPKGKGAQRLGVDHNHATGAVRGLLCTRGQWSCNRIVGRFRDNPRAFQRGADYLTQPPAFKLRGMVS